MEVLKIEVSWLPTSCETCQFLKKKCNSESIIDLFRVGYRYTTTCLASQEVCHHNLPFDYDSIKKVCPLVLKNMTMKEKVESAKKWINEFKYERKHNIKMQKFVLDVIDDLQIGYNYWEQNLQIEKALHGDKVNE
jgi:hypothetical protein